MHPGGGEKGKERGHKVEAIAAEVSINEDAHRIYEGGDSGGGGEAHCLRQQGLFCSQSLRVRF